MNLWFCEPVGDDFFKDGLKLRIRTAILTLSSRYLRENLIPAV